MLAAVLAQVLAGCFLAMSLWKYRDMAKPATEPRIGELQKAMAQVLARVRCGGAGWSAGTSARLPGSQQGRVDASFCHLDFLKEFPHCGRKISANFGESRLKSAKIN